MKAWSVLRTYLTIYVTLASPFLLLTFINLYVPINIEVIVYGYLFSFLASCYYTFGLREKRTIVSFDDRDLFIHKFKTRMQTLGYVEKSREALLTTYEPLDTILFEKEILAYIFTDSATIIAPKKFIKNLQKNNLPGTNWIFKRGAQIFGSASSSNHTNQPTCKP